MHSTAILFPLGVRLSTLLAAAAFAGVAISRLSRLPLIAGWVWLTSFEAVFQIMSIVLGRLPLGLLSPIFFLALAVATLRVARHLVRVDLRFLIAAVPFLIIWAATGFHLNGHQHGMFSLHTRIADFDPTAEIWNEAAKTLWALAFLSPLMTLKRRRRALSAEAEAV